MTIRIAGDPGWAAIDEWRAESDRRTVAITIGCMGASVHAMQGRTGRPTVGGTGDASTVAEAFSRALAVLDRELAEQEIRDEVEAEVRRRRGAA